MISRSKKLEPKAGDSAQLESGTSQALIAPDGQIINYTGTVLRTSQGQHRTVEFEFNTDPILDVEIDIPYFISADAQLTVRINQEQIEQISLQAAQDGKKILHRLIKNIRKESARQVKSKLELIFTFSDAHGTAAILMSGTELSMNPMLKFKWDSSYSCQSAFFFLLAWLTLLELLILAVATAIPATQKYKVFAVFLILAPWLFGLLGISDFVRLKIRDWLRRFYVWAEARRRLLLGGLAIVFLLASAGAAAVIYSLAVRYYYARLIEEAIEQKSDDAIRRAFVWQPWRKEAQLLFEGYAHLIGNTSPIEGFGGYIREFTSNEEIKAAIERERQRDSPPFNIDADAARAYNDPVIWYASLLPQTEKENELPMKEEAIRYLNSRNKPEHVEAKLLRSVLQLYILKLTNQDQEVEKQVHELQQFLESQNTPRLKSMHEYQIAWDIIGQNALLNCYKLNQQQQEDMNKAAADAIKAFRQVLEARVSSRKTFTSGEEPSLWVRPPGKMLLYHIFKFYSIRKNALSEELKKKSWGNCAPFEAMFKEQVFDIYSKLGKKDDSVWFDGTLLDGEAQSYIKNNLLTTGWSY
jgi:hypothetical protein